MEEWTDAMDDQIGSVLNSNMCTLMCPCYEGDTGEYKALYESKIDETKANRYARTWEESTASYTKLIWSNDEEFSFTSLEECSDYLASYGSIYDEADTTTADDEVDQAAEDDPTVDDPTVDDPTVDTSTQDDPNAVDSTNVDLDDFDDTF